MMSAGVETVWSMGCFLLCAWRVFFCRHPYHFEPALSAGEMDYGGMGPAFRSVAARFSAAKRVR
jgi:hypothetical protein